MSEALPHESVWTDPMSPTVILERTLRVYPKRLAVIATIYRHLSHAQHFVDRFLVGYPYEGRWVRPDMRVVSLFVDQRPEGGHARCGIEQSHRFAPAGEAIPGRRPRWCNASTSSCNRPSLTRSIKR